MTVFTQMILMVMTTMTDSNEYDGRSKDHDVVLQEVGSSTEEEEDDYNVEQEVNDDIEDEFCQECDDVLLLFDLEDVLEILTKVVSQCSPHY